MEQVVQFKIDVKCSSKCQLWFGALQIGHFPKAMENLGSVAQIICEEFTMK